MKTLVGFLVIFLFSISLFGQDNTNYMRKYGISDEEDWRKKRESYYLNSINIDENDIHSYYFKGIDNMENGSYDLAIIDFKKSQKIEENNTHDWLTLTKEETFHPTFYIGVCFNMLSQSDSALYYFNKTLNKHPEFESVYIEIAKLYANEENFEMGLEYCQRLLDINNASIDAIYIQSLIYYLQGDVPRSQKELKYALKLSPKNYFLNVLSAAIYYDRNKPNHAIKLLTTAINSEPEIAITYLMRGLSYIKKMEYGQAYTDFMAGSILDSTYSIFPLFMGYASIKLDNVEAGVISLAKSIRLDMLNPGLYYSESFEQLELNDLVLYMDEHKIYGNERQVGYLLIDLMFNYDRMKNYSFIKDYALNNPNSVFASRIYNYVLFRQHGHDLTVHRTNSLILINDSLSFIKVLNAKLKHNKNEYWKSINILTSVIQRIPQYTKAYYEIALSYLMLDETSKAIENFDIALKLNPEYELATLDRGYTYFLAGLYGQALNDFKIGNYNSPLLLNTIGMSYDGLDNIDSAMYYYDKAIQIDPQYYEAYECRGSINLKRKEYSEALDDYNMCIELVGENPEYLLARSIANRELGNIETVIPDLKKAISLDSSFYDAYVELGWTYYIIGDYDNCIAHSMLAQQGESNIVAMYNVALSKLRQDKYAEAELFYQVAMEQDLIHSSTNNKIAIERLKYLIENNIHKEKAEEILNILMHK